jgi:hypothetical protein
MHRWRFQWLVRWLAPTFTFVVAICAVVIRQKASAAGLAFLDDRAYRSLAVARMLAEHQTYAFQAGERIPAVHDVLWRLVLGVIGLFSANGVAIVYLLGGACGMVTLLLCFRLANRLFPFPPFIIYSSILLIAAPCFLVDIVDGAPTALATLLMTAAILLHMEGLTGRRAPLPLACAWLVGLLMWIRIEFGLVWLVFSVHAFALGWARPRKEKPVLLVITRSGTGILVLALCLFPLIAWNHKVIGVPWPRAMGAPFALDLWLSGTPAQALRSHLDMTKSAMAPAFSQWASTPFLAGVLERALTWFGALFIAGLSLWRAEERPYTIILFLLVLLPVFFALAVPYVGWSGAPILFGTLGPLFVIAAAFGIFRIPFLMENLYRKWKPGLPAAPGFNAWWIAMGSILLLVSIARNGSLMHRWSAAREAQTAARRSVLAVLAGGQVEGKRVVTDEPGWIGYATGRHVLDLTGEFSPEVLTCLGRSGRLDPPALGSLLKEQKPDSVVLWNPDNEFVLELVPHRLVERNPPPAKNTWPRVGAINGSGVF